MCYAGRPWNYTHSKALCFEIFILVCRNVCAIYFIPEDYPKLEITFSQH